MLYNDILWIQKNRPERLYGPKPALYRIHTKSQAALKWCKLFLSSIIILMSRR